MWLYGIMYIHFRVSIFHLCLRSLFLGRKENFNTSRQFWHENWQFLLINLESPCSKSYWKMFFRFANKTDSHVFNFAVPIEIKHHEKQSSSKIQTHLKHRITTWTNTRNRHKNIITRICSKEVFVAERLYMLLTVQANVLYINVRYSGSITSYGSNVSFVWLITHKGIIIDRRW